MNRRSFLQLVGGGIAAAVAAPYGITTPGLLMPVKTLWTPPKHYVAAIHANYTDSIQMVVMDGYEVRAYDGLPSGTSIEIASGERVTVWKHPGGIVTIDREWLRS